VTVRQVRIRRRAAASRGDEAAGTTTAPSTRSSNDALDRLLATLDELLD
jgi:hypothetical protein